jgi:uncharacterized membrane protein YhaH (DUF805 family)
MSVVGVVLRTSPVTANTWSRLDLPVWLELILLLVAIYIGLMLSIKRSHDLGFPGFFSLALFVPLLNLWALVMFSFFKGTEEENKYGPPDSRFPNVFVNESPSQYRVSTQKASSGKCP